MTTKIQNFQPGVYIELDDVFTGTRKIARVTETGQSYDDLDEKDATPFPIYEALKPVEVGNILGWGLHLVDHHPDEHPKFRALVDQLIHSGVDVLTYNRAAHWAFIAHNYDYATALAEGKKATALIHAARIQMDLIISSAGDEK